jgi:ArsR family transcriptional regulator
MNMGSYSCCTPNKSEFNKLSDLTSLLKLVAGPVRLKILCILRQSEHCVCDFEEHLGLSQSLLSHHLADLREAGLILGEKKGLKVIYSLTTQGKLVTEQIFSLTERRGK